MDFLGGALPNVMFIIGILAIGLGLGIELKLVPLNKEIDKTGRVGAIIVGAMLVAGSILIYLNPALAKRDQPTSTSTLANAAIVAPVATQAATVAPAPTEAPPAPTAVPPAPTDAPPAPTAVPQVKVPDLHGLGDKDIKHKLDEAGLVVGNKNDTCTGPDKGDPKVRKGRVLCQNPPAGTSVSAGSAVDYTLAGR